MAEKRAWVPPIEEAPNGETGLAKRRGGAAEDTRLWADSTDPVDELSSDDEFEYVEEGGSGSESEAEEEEEAGEVRIGVSRSKAGGVHPSLVSLLVVRPSRGAW